MDASISLMYANPAFQPVTRTSLSPEQAGCPEFPDPRGRLSTLQLQRLKERQKERWVVVTSSGQKPVQQSKEGNPSEVPAELLHEWRAVEDDALKHQRGSADADSRSHLFGAPVTHPAEWGVAGGRPPGTMVGQEPSLTSSSDDDSPFSGRQSARLLRRLMSGGASDAKLVGAKVQPCESAPGSRSRQPAAHPALMAANKAGRGRLFSFSRAGLNYSGRRVSEGGGLGSARELPSTISDVSSSGFCEDSSGSSPRGTARHKPPEGMDIRPPGNAVPAGIAAAGLPSPTGSYDADNSQSSIRASGVATLPYKAAAVHAEGREPVRGRRLFVAKGPCTRSRSPSLSAAATAAAARFMSDDSSLDGDASSLDGEQLPCGVLRPPPGKQGKPQSIAGGVQPSLAPQSLPTRQSGFRRSHVPRSSSVTELMRSSVQRWRGATDVQRRRDLMLLRGFEGEQRLRWLAKAFRALVSETRRSKNVAATASRFARRRLACQGFRRWRTVAVSKQKADATLVHMAREAAGILRARAALESWQMLPLIAAAERVRQRHLVTAAFLVLKDLHWQAKALAAASDAAYRLQLSRRIIFAWSAEFVEQHARPRRLRAVRVAAFLERRRGCTLAATAAAWRGMVADLLDLRDAAGGLLMTCRARLDLGQWRQAAQLARMERQVAQALEARLIGAAFNGWIHHWARQMACRVMAAHCRVSAAARAIRAWREVALEGQGTRALLGQAWAALVGYVSSRRRKAALGARAWQSAWASLARRAITGWTSWCVWRWRKAAAHQAGCIAMQRRCILLWRSHLEEVALLEHQLGRDRKAVRARDAMRHWRRNAYLSAALRTLSIQRLVRMGSGALRRWQEVVRAEAGWRVSVAAGLLRLWASAAARSARLKDRLVLFLTTGYEKCMARAFRAWRDARVARLNWHRESVALAGQLGQEGLSLDAPRQSRLCGFSCFCR